MNSHAVRRRALIAARKSTRQLPSEYQQAEWIGKGLDGDEPADASSCSLTGLHLKKDDLVYIEARNTAEASKDRILLGAYANFSIDQFVHGGTFHPWNCTLVSSVLTVERDSATIRLNKDASDNLILGAYAGSYKYLGKYYYISVIRNGVTAAELVPCYRKEDGQIGLYNTLGKQFFYCVGAWEKGDDLA